MEAEDATLKFFIRAADFTNMQDVEQLTTPEEISSLRQRLAERELAVMRNILANTELQKKIADAEDQIEQLKTEVRRLEQQPSPEIATAEISRLKKEWSNTQKAQQREQADRRAEVLAARGMAQQAQRKYEEEARTRRAESAHSSGTIARLERELGEARTRADNIGAAQDRQSRIYGRMAFAAAGVLATICGGAGFWVWGMDHHSPANVAVAAVERPRAATHAIVTPAQMPKDFSRSVGRLSEALENVPGLTPQEVLRQIHASHAKDDPGLCSFQWNNGQPSLMLAGTHANVTISSSLGRCAQAVEEFRAKGNAPAFPPGH